MKSWPQTVQDYPWGKVQVLSLPADIHNVLVRDGKAAWETVPTQDPAIVFNRDLGDYFFEFAPQEDLNHLLSSAYLVTRDESGKCLRLAQCEPLRTFLPAEASRLRERIPRVSLLDAISEQDAGGVWTDCITDEAKRAIQNREEFLDQVAVCGCGIPGCSAEYAWIKDDVCLLYVGIRAAGIEEVWLLPFRIVRESRVDS